MLFRLIALALLAATGVYGQAFRIAVYNTTRLLTIAGLGPDGQSGGNVGAPVLSINGTQYTYKLTGTNLTASSGAIAWSYPTGASKFYFATSQPSYNGILYPPFSCSLGSFNTTVLGYLLSCVQASRPATPLLFYQSGTTNYVMGYPGYNEPPPPGPDYPAGQLYAIFVS